MRKLFKERKLFKGGNYMRKYGIWNLTGATTYPYLPHRTKDPLDPRSHLQGVYPLHLRPEHKTKYICYGHSNFDFLHICSKVTSFHPNVLQPRKKEPPASTKANKPT